MSKLHETDFYVEGIHYWVDFNVENDTRYIYDAEGNEVLRFDPDMKVFGNGKELCIAKGFYALSHHNGSKCCWSFDYSDLTIQTHEEDALKAELRFAQVYLRLKLAREWRVQKDGFIIDAKTGCTCCRSENFVDGVYDTLDEAKAAKALHLEKKSLSSQYAERGIYGIRAITYDELADGRVIIGESVLDGARFRLSHNYDILSSVGAPVKD